jgi:hypothetical protein
MFHTIVPLDEIFQGFEQIQAPIELRIGGVIAQVNMLSSSEAQIVRIISPHIEDYLESSYTPGAIIRLINQIETFAQL